MKSAVGQQSRLVYCSLSLWPADETLHVLNNHESFILFCDFSWNSSVTEDHKMCAFLLIKTVEHGIETLIRVEKFIADACDEFY